MDTPAWRALSPKAQALYTWLKFEWHGPKSNNNGRLQFSCRQAARSMGIGKNAAMIAFRELQEKGFIVVTKLGALGVEGEARGPSYELTELPLPGSQRGRRLYLVWSEGKDFPVARHQANNPAGRNGRKSPSAKSGRTCLRNDDVQGEPVIEMKTPCLQKRDVDGWIRAGTVINLETSLTTIPSAQSDPPDLRTPVSPDDCFLRYARAD